MLALEMKKEIHNGYFVDADGNIFNPKGKQIKPYLHTKNGYLQIDLGWKNRRRAFVHTLVAENFVSGHFDGAKVDHIDRNKSNNKATNLRWVTPKENYHNADNSERAINISNGLRKAWQNSNKFIRQKTLGPWNKK